MKKILSGAVLMLLSTIFFTGNSVAFANEGEQNTNIDEIVIYDKFGEKITPSNELFINSQEDLIRGVNPPTTVKWLNNSATYQSDGFSGSGRRYSGYTFSTSNSSGKFKLTFRTGGFGVNVIANPGDPWNVSQSYNLPLSGSPYTLITSGYFYFLVDNPRSGQTYHVGAIR